MRGPQVVAGAPSCVWDTYTDSVGCLDIRHRTGRGVQLPNPAASPAPCGRSSSRLQWDSAGVRISSARPPWPGDVLARLAECNARSRPDCGSDGVGSVIRASQAALGSWRQPFTSLPPASSHGAPVPWVAADDPRALGRTAIVPPLTPQGAEHAAESRPPSSWPPHPVLPRDRLPGSAAGAHHALPPWRTETRPSKICRTDHLQGRPRGASPGSNRWKTFHSASAAGMRERGSGREHTTSRSWAATEHGHHAPARV